VVVVVDFEVAILFIWQVVLWDEEEEQLSK